jgi:hypothetical protein
MNPAIGSRPSYYRTFGQKGRMDGISKSERGNIVSNPAVYFLERCQKRYTLYRQTKQETDFDDWVLCMEKWNPYDYM